MRWIAVLCLTAALTGSALGQDKKFAPPAAIKLEADVIQQIDEKASHLAKAIQALRRQGMRDPGLADVEIYVRAIEMTLRHEEFFSKDVAKWMHDLLDRGILRTRFLSQGEMPWTQVAGQSVVRGYRSRVDGSVQPYAVSYPPGYGKEAKRWRVDLVMHGRGSTLTEVSFLRNFSDKPVSQTGYIQIDVFGRGNNAYRWAGEADVFEALESFIANEAAAGRALLIDPAKTVLRGFSMGGAGSWHIGLHHPDRWAVVAPGAGFTTTHGYIGGLPNPLPPHQEACLRIYDAVDYAANAANVPIVAYSGSEDAQKAAADNIENRLKQLGIPMTHLIAPNLAHSFPPDWQKRADAIWSEHVAKGRPEYPGKVWFTTYTMKYPRCFWVDVLGLEKHYEQTTVKADRLDDGFNVTTANVRQFHLQLPNVGEIAVQKLKIDGQTLEAKPWSNPDGTTHLYLKKVEGKWKSVLPQLLVTERQQRPQKVQRLSGPIDDAFTDAFLCVRGTGKPWQTTVQSYADADLKRFDAEWSKYMRGTLPVKDDVDVTADDIASKHLILFGDPGSNSLIHDVLDGLPLKWNADGVVLAGKKYSAKDHVPALIYPNPLNASRYVVLNSGHTFHAREFKGTNAQLYPRLGDYAVLKLAEGDNDPLLRAEPAMAGLFDEYWQVTAK